MGTVDEAKEVELLEEMFKDRFTDNDAVYMEIKSKNLSQSTVIYPWRFKKQWNKTWDTSSDRRDHSRHRYNDRDRNHQDNSRYRDRSHDGESSRYRDRSRDGESSRYRDDHFDRRNSYKRNEDRQ